MNLECVPRQAGDLTGIRKGDRETKAVTVNQSAVRALADHRASIVRGGSASRQCAFGLAYDSDKIQNPRVLSQEDFWVGKTISHARMAYETWTELMAGKIKVEPERSSNHLGGGYVNLFTNYTKEAFLNAVAALHRGFFEYKNGALVRSEVARRMLEYVSESQIDEFMKLAEPLRTLRNEDQHKEDPKKLPVWSTRITPEPPTIGTFSGDHVDPSVLYELLKSFEPSIGYVAFLRAAKRANDESK